MCLTHKKKIIIEFRKRYWQRLMGVVKYRWTRNEKILPYFHNFLPSGVRCIIMLCYYIVLLWSKFDSFRYPFGYVCAYTKGKTQLGRRLTPALRWVDWAGGRAHLAGANRLIREAFYWGCSSRAAAVPLRKPKQRCRNERRPQIVGRREAGEEINNGRRRKQMVVLVVFAATGVNGPANEPEKKNLFL